MNDQEIEDYVREYAPEMDPKEVREFMAEHDKPEDEPDSHVAWATKLLRGRGEGQYGEGASIDTVSDEMQRRDER